MNMYPPFMFGPREYQEWTEFIEKKREQEEKKKKEKKTPEAPKVSLIGALMLLIGLGPFVGMATSFAMLYTFKHWLDAMQLMLK